VTLEPEPFRPFCFVAETAERWKFRARDRIRDVRAVTAQERRKAQLPGEWGPVKPEQNSIEGSEGAQGENGVENDGESPQHPE
jgi:hypothetical protein